MSIYGNIQIGTTPLAAGTVNVYDSSNTQLSSYTITEAWKYGAEAATDTALVVNSFSWTMTIKVITNGTTYIVTSDQLDDSNKGTGCPAKTSINFVSKNCRYDITLPQPAAPTWWGGWWGWGWWALPPATTTGTVKVVTIVSSGVIENNLLNDNRYTPEFNQAYQFAFAKGITTMPSIWDANMASNLIRVHMAKMMVNYAINVLGKTLDTWLVCTFDDMTDQSAEMQEYAIKACQLGLMGKWATTFMPMGIATRAEFGTVLSRLLYGAANEWWWSEYYTNHLKVLKEHGIITNDTPNTKEKRGYIMLMLMRTAK